MLVSVSSSKLATRASRSLFAKASAMPSVALTEEFPAVPPSQPAATSAPTLTTSTALSGLALGSDDCAASVATIGVQLATGTRDECDETAGVSQLFSKLAFRATQTRSDLRLFRDIEAIGGVVHARAGREFVRYSVSVLPDQLPAAAEILAETTLAPKFALYDVDAQKRLVRAEHDAIRDDPSQTLLEGVHAAAFYDDVALGRPLAPVANLEALDPEALWSYYNQHVNTANAALVGAGVAHATLTDLANQFFGSLGQGSKVARASAAYVGGETREKYASKFTRVALALPTVGRESADFGASQVLRGLLSVRLKHHKKVAAVLSSYSDVALMSLCSYAAPWEAGALVDLLAAEFVKAASTPASKEELAAAKTTAALEALEDYSTQAGNLGRIGLMAASGRVPESPSQIVENVTAAKLQELARNALKATPSVAAYGVLSTVPHVDAVASKLQ
ncbi:unnamed protein product [Hyaloperonospora brassicae]|uniref:Peptidase M16 N-terminal domain-containing protein n=1 Tax=Hyaloperonospora brassicae TaxID=162125 RepID=A0AAV0T256_HYABA|nr:unnamed protein product [Hyaloperonospora brassicae]